jgi:hypothetical protein
LEDILIFEALLIQVYKSSLEVKQVVYFHLFEELIHFHQLLMIDYIDFATRKIEEIKKLFSIIFTNLNSSGRR